MSGRLLPTLLVVLVGLCAFGLSLRWIQATDAARWTTSYGRARHVDQRWGVPIAIAVDTFLVAAGVAGAANGTYWAALAALAAAQTALVTVTLMVVRHHSDRRRSIN